MDQETTYRIGLANLIVKADRLRKKVHYDNVPLSIILSDALRMAVRVEAEKIAVVMGAAEPVCIPGLGDQSPCYCPAGTHKKGA